jgi:hypothetical protein
MTNDTIAFLSSTLRKARIDITHDYRICSTNGEDRGEIIYEGETVPFRIITREEQLRGIWLRDFIVLDASVHPAMVEIARSRVRPA